MLRSSIKSIKMKLRAVQTGTGDVIRSGSRKTDKQIVIFHLDGFAVKYKQQRHVLRNCVVFTERYG